MIKVRYTTSLPYPVHGWDFDSDETLFYGINWQEYIQWLVECSPALRVWLNDEMIWNYERGWLVTPIQPITCHGKEI